MSLVRNLSAIQDREICCYSVSCKEKDNIGKLITFKTQLNNHIWACCRHKCVSLCADITLQWLIQHSKSRRSWKWRLPRCSCGLSPPKWSRVPDSHPSTASVMYALSAHYRHLLYHPLHYHRNVAPVQHYRGTPAAVSGVWANVPVMC